MRLLQRLVRHIFITMELEHTLFSIWRRDKRWDAVDVSLSLGAIMAACAAETEWHCIDTIARKLAENPANNLNKKTAQRAIARLIFCGALTCHASGKTAFRFAVNHSHRPATLRTFSLSKGDVEAS
jgi:hypothetical protein